MCKKKKRKKIIIIKETVQLALLAPGFLFYSIICMWMDTCLSSDWVEQNPSYNDMCASQNNKRLTYSLLEEKEKKEGADYRLAVINTVPRAIAPATTNMSLHSLPLPIAPPVNTAG